MASDLYDSLKCFHILEIHRVGSFRNWPFDESSPCSVAKMAEAGFFWNGNDHDTDTVTCFLCAKTLDGWEYTDEPWKEHFKHAPQCFFAKQGIKESELTVEQFLNLFRMCVKNKCEQVLNNDKRKFQKAMEASLNKFLVKNAK